MRPATVRAAALAALLTLAALAVWPPRSLALTAPRVTSMRLAIEITGVHVDRWHVQEGRYPDPAQMWVSGRGAQTLGFSTPKPVTYLASVVSGTLPGGERLSPLALTPLVAKPMKASLRRRASWRANDGELCDREGGCEETVPVVPLHQTPSCPARRLALPGALDTVARSGSSVRNSLTASFSTVPLTGLWPSCPPDIDGVTRPLALAQPHAVAFGGAIRQIAHLRRGDTVSFKAAYSRGAVDGAETARCPSLGGPGQQECAVTDVTVEVRRLR